MSHKIFSYIAALALAAGATEGQAQTTAYVCDGYDYDAIQINSRTDIAFSTDQKQVTIGKETFDMADVDSIIFHEPQYPAIDIVWNGGSANVTVDSRITGVSYTVNGGYVTISSTNTSEELLYRLSGSSEDGGLLLNGSYKLRMDLNGVKLTSKSGCPMDIECGKRIEVKLQKGTVNSFCDGANSQVKGAFYTKGHLELKGKGTLNVTGNAKHALCAGEYLQFKSSCGTINILSAVSDGIHCGKGKKTDAENSRLIIDGGTINISGAGSDCIDCDDYGSAFINGGSLTLNVSQTDGTGLKCDSILYMNGGEIQLNVTGNISQGIRYCYNGYFSGGTIEGTITGNGAKGIKAKAAKNTTVVNGGDAHFDGTDVTLTIEGGTNVADQSKCYGIHIDKDLYQTAGTITLHVNNTEAGGYKAKNTYLTGGSISQD